MWGCLIPVKGMLPLGSYLLGRKLCCPAALTSFIYASYFFSRWHLLIRCLSPSSALGYQFLHKLLPGIIRLYVWTYTYSSFPFHLWLLKYQSFFYYRDHNQWCLVASSSSVLWGCSWWCSEDHVVVGLNPRAPTCKAKHSPKVHHSPLWGKAHSLYSMTNTSISLIGKAFLLRSPFSWVTEVTIE